MARTIRTLSFPIAVGTAAALALTLSGATERLVVPIEAEFGGVIMPAAGLVFGVAFAVAFLRRAAAALPAFVIAFALANRIAAPGAPANYALTDPCKTRPAIYEAIVDASTWLGSIDPTYTRVRTWFDDSERITLGPDGCSVGAGDIGQSVTSMAFSQLIVEPQATGDVSLDAVQAVSDGESILAVITASTRPWEMWNARLREVGLTLREVAGHRVRLRDTSFMVHAWIVEPSPPEGIVFGPSLTTIANGARDGPRQARSPASSRHRRA